jgi:hypothetical protein
LLSHHPDREARNKDRNNQDNNILRAHPTPP